MTNTETGEKGDASRARVMLLDMIAIASQLRASLETRLNAAKPAQDEKLTLEQTAKLLGRCTRTVVRWVDKGYLPARRVPRDRYLTWQFSRSEIMRFKEQRLS